MLAEDYAPRSAAVALIWSSSGAAQHIVSVHNAASGGASIPGNGVAPGSLITIRSLRGGPVSINPDLSRVSVELRPASGGQNVPAKVLQGFTGSYLALLPAGLPRGQYNVVLAVDGQVSLPAGMEVVPVAFGLFARGRNGFGPALVQNLTPGGAARLNLFTDPGRTGDYLILGAISYVSRAGPDQCAAARRDAG